MTSPVRAEDQDTGDLEDGEIAEDEPETTDCEDPSDEEERQYTFGTCARSHAWQL